MSNNPIDDVYVDSQNVDKDDVRDFSRERIRIRMANVAEVQATDLSDQLGIEVDGNKFDLDPMSSDPHDGVNVLVDSDGNRFVIVPGDAEFDLTTSKDKHDFRESIGASPVVHGNVLCPHRGLKVTYVNATSVQIVATWLVLFNSNWSGERVGPIELTADITTAGANGLDTGSEGSSRWYHLWVCSAITPIAAATNTSTSSSKLIDSGADFTTDGVKAGDVVRNLTDGTEARVTAKDSGTQLALSADIFTGTGKSYEVIAVCSLLSESATAPTLPAGYTHKGYVGAVYNNSSSNFQTFFQTGNFVQINSGNAVASGNAASYTSLDCSALMPPTATVGLWGAVVFTSSGNNLVDCFMAPHGSSTTPTFGQVRVGSPAAGPSPDFSFEAPAAIAFHTAQTLYYYVSGTNGLATIQARGFWY